MKIALLKSRLSYRGGLEKYTLRLADAFIRKGCQVTILTTEEQNPLFLPSIDVIPLMKGTKSTLYNLIQFDRACSKWLNQHPQDYIFGLERTTFQTHYRAGSGVHATFLKQRALVDSLFKRFTTYSNPQHRLVLSLEKAAFESLKLHCLFTNSEMVKKEILTTYKTDPKKIEVIHNGVEWKEWEIPFQKSLFQGDSKPFQFLFIGNDYRRKGLTFLLRALAQLKTRDFHLTIVGKDKSTEKFQALAHLLKLDKHVTFAGPQKQVLPFYQNADALVIPSLYDPFANVTVEALAMGLFVVTSAFNGGKEILSSKTGMVIENLICPNSFVKALEIALNYPKTSFSAEKIRMSIRELDFSIQLDKIVQKTLESSQP